MTVRVFNKTGKKLKEIDSRPFDSEKGIQDMIEESLVDVFGLDYVRSEFPIRGYRVDTLCFDPVNKSFVIIEYKKDKKFSVIDQGYTYLSLLLDNKSDFVLEYNEKKGKTLKRDQVDWSQSRIIFISPEFTDYQKQSVNFKDVPFGLWEIRKYGKELFTLSEHRPNSEVSISSTTKKGDGVVSKVSKEIRVYTESHHVTERIREKNPKIVEVYENLKDRVLSLSEVEMGVTKVYISFKYKRPVVDVEVGQKSLKVTINLKKGSLKDPKKLSRDVSKVGHRGNGDYCVYVTPETDLDYLMFLINQSYKDKVSEKSEKK